MRVASAYASIRTGHDHETPAPAHLDPDAHQGRAATAARIRRQRSHAKARDDRAPGGLPRPLADVPVAVPRATFPTSAPRPRPGALQPQVLSGDEEVQASRERPALPGLQDEGRPRHQDADTRRRSSALGPRAAAEVQAHRETKGSGETMSDEYDQQRIANFLSPTQKEFLVDHVDGPRPIRNFGNEANVRNGLISKGLVRYEQSLNVTSRPSATVLTEAGRNALCAVLAVYAERLIRADKLLDRPVQPKAATSEEREQLFRNLMALRRYYEQPMRRAYGAIPQAEARADHEGHGGSPEEHHDQP